MPQKAGYTPGDVASFLAKQSSGTAAIKEQSQLRALFDKPVTAEPMQKKKETAAAMGSIVKALKEAKTVPSTVGPKSKKRSASQLEGASQRIDKSEQPSKRLKKDPVIVPGSPEPSTSDETEPTVKNVERKLSQNELNAKRRLEAKQKEKISKDDAVKNKRTVFVGNVALTASKKTITKLFKPFGKVEAVRIRSVPVAAQKKPKKALVIKKEFDPDRHSMNAYVVFATEEEAEQSLQLNGTELEGLHIRVDLACATKKHDHKSTIFVGNMPFNVEEETARKHFDVCGEIENVRIIRNKLDGSGKGFGYVKFADQSSVSLALKMDGQELLGRALRVKKAAKKPKKKKLSQAEDVTMKQNKKQTKARNETTKPKMMTTKPAVKAGQTKPAVKAGQTKLAVKAGQTKPAVKVGQTKPAVKSGQVEKVTGKDESNKTGTKPKKPLRKFGDLKNRLKSMNSSSVTSRKEKHGIKKAMREMVRERKKLALGKLLTGGKKN